MPTAEDREPLVPPSLRLPASLRRFLLAPVKLGLVAASVVSGAAGALVLVRAGARLRGGQAG